MLETPRVKIVMIEDEQDIIELVSYTLTKEGFDVEGLSSTDHVVDQLIEKKPDVLILDLMLPGQNGYDICKQLKQNPLTTHIPILILSAKSEESDIVVGLELGADDFMTKPFSPKVLTARVRSILRRKTEPLETLSLEILKKEGMIIDPKAHSVTLDGKAVNLTTSEFKTVYFLMQKQGWVFSRYQIVEAIRGEHYVVTDRAIDVLIVGLRKKLGQYGYCIETVRGVGYRFKV